ncbi:aldehyde dehydrogenase family protein [Telmatocola sphagniphila]|uniref:Aldehyde dehydrogenase family protein n=1 Tax=Telmatocola sphagniphila TaxID=1123043 RepID=A0A8E6EZ34_9BACT|nr:aldehyde dehydrogenase family protein [Telmatocola sphagniphila]QVL33011.1 aldehyde dehydrogenase family protein [Telmatocola sphagniphila]
MLSFKHPGRHCIAGSWHPGTGEILSRNPANLDEIIGAFPVGTQAESIEAVAAARHAFPNWRRTSRLHRAECFNRLANIIERDQEYLAELMAREVGKTLSECRAEVVEGLHMVQYVFGTGRMPTGYVIDSEISEKDAFLRRKPWGVVAVITPWNFPFAVPLWMLGPSLLEGNTAVFKPSEDSPAIGQRLFELFLEAGFPPGTINLLHGDGTTGEALVDNPEVSVVLFTGSYEVGKRIQQVSANHFDRIVAAEMGSKSAVIICDDARIDLAVSAGLISAFKTSGQRCVSAGRLLVQEKIFDKFAEKLLTVTKRIRIGNPLDERNFTGPVIHENSVEKVLKYNRLSKEEGAEVLLVGERMLDHEHKRGCYLTPHVYRIAHSPQIRCIREEVFGPHLALIPFKTLDDAIEIYNDTDFGLSMAVITEDFRKMRLFREECNFGMGYVNLPCIGAEVHLPFGGVKKSGNGHPSAAGLVDAVTHKIAWTVNHGTEIKMAQGLKTDV